MTIVARTQQQLTSEEASAIRKFFREHPELGDGADGTPSEQLMHNANAFEDYPKRWNVVVTDESLQAAYEKLRAVENILKVTSEARMRYQEAAKTGGYDQSHQDILDAFLRRVHLVHDPADDRTFENCTKLFNAMKGRPFTQDSLMFVIQNLQGKAVKLHWLDRPRQNAPETRGHAHIPGEKWMAKDETNRSFLPSHSGNPRLNGQLERDQRERDRQRFNQPPDDPMAAHNWIWAQEIKKAVAEGRTHTERARIVQVAQQTPGGPRLQAEAAQKEVALIRQHRESNARGTPCRILTVRENARPINH